ncbi:MAG: glycerophosphodiester phosphodiesterase [Acidobacteriota bacterium]
MKNHSRRTFLKQSATLTATVTASGLFLNSVIGKALFKAVSARPLEMLVLGDSAMWGQGLKQEQKFYTLTQRWLEGALKGRPVNTPKVKAHSGATILPKNGNGQACNREVNVSIPTIHAQLDEAVREYQAATTDLRSIDVVLVDGGINDMGVFNLLQPFISKKKIVKAADDYCYVAMKDLLHKVGTTFCNARVVVTGYFPLISRQTAPDLFLKLILLAFGEKKFISWFGFAAFNLIRRGLLLDKQDLGPILAHAAEISNVWYTESTLALQRAVGDINRDLNAGPQSGGCDQSIAATVTPHDPLNRRVVFAYPNFKCENAYGAPQTFLWKLVDAQTNFSLFDSPIDRLASNDFFFNERAEWCKCEAAGKRGLQLKICQRAGTGHPNVLGAQEYTRAITTELATILPFTGWTEAQATVLSGTSTLVTEVALPAGPQTVTGRGADHPFFTQAPKKQPEVIAHRGGDGQWPGETMYAFKKAMEIGVDVLEMDVYLTRDNELILMHDRDIKTTTKGEGSVDEFTLAELKELNAAYHWSSVCGDDRSYRDDPNKDLKVTTLKEVFDAFPHMRMNIEMKPARRSPAAKLCQMIRSHDMTDKVLVASLLSSYLDEFRCLCPEAATSASGEELAKFKASSLIGGSYRPYTDAIQIKDKLFAWQIVTSKLVALAHCSNLTREEEARCRKLPVHAWTVNEPKEMKRMIALGVDGIITDCPGPLLSLLNQSAELQATPPDKGFKINPEG